MQYYVSMVQFITLACKGNKSQIHNRKVFTMPININVRV